MEAPTKRKQVRIYLDDDAEANLQIIKRGVRTFSESAILTEVVSAALEACAQAGRLNFPLKFQFVETRVELNEPPPRYKIRKEK